ncbi:hypothetical protein QU585_10165 [Lactiplantibacillus plantarum]|uniref:hypothetical protein n=1 Tax=Lactiplantibacillus plantarum TaxID=1590 RepID=UPI002741049C|nr:hypothetical protein [Lactiplantibacillus plantarum]MDP5372521.1 hypothetical protein [Lactiplantibacillus plantarum]
MKILYFWDSNFKLVNSIFYQNEEDMPSPMPSNATSVAPADGLYEPSWNGSAWVGITREEWLAQQPAATPATPTTDQKFQAQLALQMATMQKNQAEFNAQVLLQLADLKESLETSAASTASATSTVESK